MESIDFTLLEKSFADSSLPELPADNIDDIFEFAPDPIACAKAVHERIMGRSAEGQEHFLQQTIHEIGYRYMGSFVCRKMNITLDRDFVAAKHEYATDMADLLDALRTYGDVRAGGIIQHIGREYYTDYRSSIKRPIISVYMDNAAFINPLKDNELTPIENRLVVPVTAISDHLIGEHYDPLEDAV